MTRVVYAQDGRSGWTWQVHHLSDFNFERLNPNIEGAPIYWNGDKLWPKPVGAIVVKECDEIKHSEYKLKYMGSCGEMHETFSDFINCKSCLHFEAKEDQ